jgi:peptidoglycan-N-acetylglucosamine deacetylase
VEGFMFQKAPKYFTLVLLCGMLYAVKTPWWLKKLYRRCIWHLPSGGEKTLYLTFDDGPHPTITPFVLQQLAQYGAKASFFCIGQNVERFPDIYRQVLAAGHRVGNHTQHHLNGWTTEDEQYLQDVATAAGHIGSDLFRPPYGRIRFSQLKKMRDYRVVMWSVLSGDFDTGITAEQCLRNVVRHAKSGDIIVFHDSEKAFERLKGSLPVVLQHFGQLGYVFKAIE